MHLGSLFPRTGPGGSFSVRGVRRQRYHGKIKAIGNVELRSMFWRFNIKKQEFHVGAVLFADASHIWADYKRITIRDAALDADGANFAVGLGGPTSAPLWGRGGNHRRHGARRAMPRQPGAQDGWSGEGSRLCGSGALLRLERGQMKKIGGG